VGSPVAGLDADNGLVGVVVERIVDREGDAFLRARTAGSSTASSRNASMPIRSRTAALVTRYSIENFASSPVSGSAWWGAPATPGPASTVTCSTSAGSTPSATMFCVAVMAVCVN